MREVEGEADCQRQRIVVCAGARCRSTRYSLGSSGPPGSVVGCVQSISLGLGTRGSLDGGAVVGDRAAGVTLVAGKVIRNAKYAR